MYGTKAAMAKWIDVGVESDFPAGSVTPVTAGDRSVVVCRTDDQLAAVADACPHAGLPLADGELRGCVLTCQYHGYTYNVLTGKNIDFPHEEPPVPTFPVRVSEAGRVEVQIEETSETD